MTRILIVAPSWVGDALMSQPLLTLLKQQEPEATIDVLGPGWALPIYRRMPEVSGTIESPFAHGEMALGKRWRLARALRATGYDRAYVLPNSFKSALVPVLAGIPRRIGFVGEMRQPLLTDARPLDSQALPRMVERFAFLAGPREAAPARPVPRPRLHVGAAERTALLARLGLVSSQRIACFCPGAEYGPAKRWPPSRFAALARKLSALEYAVWVVGSDKERSLGEEIRAAGGDAVVNLCGRTSLDDAVVALSCAAVVVSNDSGLMHVAAALDRPMVALYGSSSPDFTPPLSDAARIVRIDLPCSPCFQRVCPLGHFDCMMKLDPDLVLAEIRRLASAPLPKIQ
jgi:heptosyltransferase-2